MSFGYAIDLFQVLEGGNIFIPLQIESNVLPRSYIILALLNYFPIESDPSKIVPSWLALFAPQ
jgi:hypothetical protein